MSVPMSLDCDAEADKEDEGAWVMETSAATAAASAMVQDPDPNAFFGNISDPFPPDIALEGQPEVEMELPEAFSIQEFLEKPDEFRPQKTFLTEYIEDETALTAAIKAPSEAAVRQLLRFGADPNLASKKGVTPISAASYKGNIPIMRMLIERGAEVNALNQSGSTALIQASHFGHPEAVRLLLENNASADFANAKGTTALMRASQEGWVEISTLLINARADVNRKNHEGMNALMLASQRGHAEMVVLLVKSGAAMDEQTAQGSTALMLACKRGHEKCVGELVGMGAEIHMLDQRDRSAYDTAVKRHHTTLTVWLSTQMQVRKIQESRRSVRATLLAEMRQACLTGRLRFNAHEIPALLLLEEAKRQIALEAPPKRQAPSRAGGASSLFSRRTSSSSGIPLHDPIQAAVAKGLTWSSNSAQGGPVATTIGSFVTTQEGALVVASLSPAACAALDSIKALLTRGREASASAVASAAAASAVSSSAMTLSSSSSSSSSSLAISAPQLQRQRPCYSDWQWAILLFRTMGLPFGIFELIAEFLPSPRIWQWSLYRLKKRCSLAPQVALNDISVIIDEIMTDANILAGPDQKQQLIKISSSPEIQAHLVERLGMPPSLLTSLCMWADTQSLLSRTSDADVAFKAPFARKMLVVASEVAKWHRQRCSSIKALGLTQEVADYCDEGVGPEVATAGEDNHSADDVMDEDTDQDVHNDEDVDDAAADDSDGETPQQAGVFGV